MTDTYTQKLIAAESPDGRDNAAGSGAYSKFQFMPDTAHALAQGTPWGKGLNPDQVKAAVTSDPQKAFQLADLYGQNSTKAITAAGLPDDDKTRFAMHRFGQAGGTSLLRADANMPVADWARSVTWGNGVSPDAVISQNRLDRYSNVGDLRNRFIGAPMGAPQSVVRLPPGGAQPAPQAAPAMPPIQAALMPQEPKIDPSALAGLFTQPQQVDPAQARAEADRRRRQALFARA
jgi:hypothetical protein